MPRLRFANTPVGFHLLRLGIFRAGRQGRARREAATHSMLQSVGRFNAALQAATAKFPDAIAAFETLNARLQSLNIRKKKKARK